MDPARLLAGLNAEQLDAVTATGGPVVVHAGAGSGKTRVLTRRIAWRIATGDTDPQRVLALTFTRKASVELKGRLRRVGLRDNVLAGTFHSVALLQLRMRWAERNIPPPTIVERKYRIISQLMGRRPGVETIDVMGELEWAKARLIEPDDYEAQAGLANRNSPIGAGDMADLMVRYAQHKRRNRLIDFDDLLSLAARDLKADPSYAAAVRWRHRHLSVDEFQDVNPLQYDLLMQWRGDSSDLFVVGDPNQAIYGWNGADPNLLNDFADREPGTQTYRLKQNYRSTPQILRLADVTLGGRAPQLATDASDGPLPVITPYPTDAAEAAGIAERIRTARTVGSSWSDQAVLVRTNAQLVVVEAALSDVGIPGKVAGGSGPLNSSEVIKAIRVLSRPGINFHMTLNELDDQIESGDMAGVGPGADDKAEQERRANLAALSRLAHDYEATDLRPTGPGFSDWLVATRAHAEQSDGDAVALATFHGAKGLEWNVVHIAGLEEGLVPITYAQTGAQLAEEDRLLYVAVTRAREQLFLSWAQNRNFGSRSHGRKPSPHLGGLEQAIGRLAQGHRTIDVREQVANARHQIRSSGGRPAVDPLLDDLTVWRSRRARAAAVAPFVIFSDQVLKAIAATRPANLGQLGTIPGVGASKLSRFGSELLDLVANHRSDATQR
jgi:DNA helicase-2/ATP-dependent DNA helicase PcrA